MLYKLQTYTAPYDLSGIKNSKTNLWVMDYSKGADRPFLASEIKKIKKGNKKIIAYMSIGEIDIHQAQ